MIYRTASRIALHQLEEEMESIAIHCSDSHEWRLKDGAINVRTHRDWAELHRRVDSQMWRYLYRGWRLSRELKARGG